MIYKIILNDIIKPNIKNNITDIHYTDIQKIYKKINVENKQNEQMYTVTLEFLNDTFENNIGHITDICSFIKNIRADASEIKNK